MKNDLEKHESDNLGGVNNFRFAYAEDVDVIPETFEGAIHHEVTLVPHARWYDGYFTEGTGNLAEPPLASDQGTTHDKQFSGVVPKDRPELVDFFNRNKSRRFILDVMDNNGQRKLVGNKSEPLYLMAGPDTKTNVPERNEYKFLFKGDGVDVSPVYNI